MSTEKKTSDFSAIFIKLAGMLKALGANFTLERSFASVSSKMSREWPRFLEAFGANFTIERPQCEHEYVASDHWIA